MTHETKRCRALVVRTTGSWYRLMCEDETVIDARLRGHYRLNGSKQTNPIAVGDRVEYTLQPDGTGVICDIEERRNCIIRRSTKLSKQTHVLAANIDQTCIIATLEEPRTSAGFIDRILVTAEAYHIPASLWFNKCDLHNSDLQKEYELLRDRYNKIGYEVHQLSALRGEGVKTLKEAVRGKVSLFCGHSGVGKSALLNAIDPTLNLRMGEISQWSHKGMHTTTFAEIFPIHIAMDETVEEESGETEHSYLIDTPGVKEFGVVDFSREELSHYFPEMRRVLPGCKFSTCTHTHEPQCAVKEAVDAGEISEERYKSYLNILQSI